MLKPISGQQLKHLTQTVLWVGLLSTISACSNQALYDIGQNHERQKCLNERGEAYEKCMRAPQKTYDEYEKERDAILKQDKGN